MITYQRMEARHIPGFGKVLRISEDCTEFAFGWAAWEAYWLGRDKFARMGEY